MKIKNLNSAIGIFFVLSSMFLLVSPAEAAVIRSGQSVVITKDSIVPGDFYVAGNDVHISGDVQGDVYIAGGTVEIQGKIDHNVVVLGGTVSVNGPVGGSIHVVGGKVTIANAVSHDVVVAGGSLIIVSSAHVDGDVLFYGNRLETEGLVKGIINANTESLTINGPVGSVDAVVGGQFLLDAHAQVSKDIIYQSTENMIRTPDASVSGTINHKKGEATTNPLQSHLPLWFTALFSALVAVLLLRPHLSSMFSAHGHTFIWSGFLGLGTLLAVPLVCGLLFVSMLGALLGTFVALLYISLLVLSFVLVHVFTGALIAKVVTQKYTVNWLWTFVGVCVTQAVLLIPVIGIISVFLGSTVVLGMVVYYTYVHLRV